MPITADALARGRMQLKSATRDQALVDKFTQIRGYNVAFSGADPRATLNEDDLLVLQSLIARSSPTVQITPEVGRSTFGGGTAAAMKFRTTFRSAVPPTPPYRVIRFVRAAQVNRNFGINKLQYTIPGYVHYNTLSEARGPAPDPQALHQALVRCFTMAKWSFDGPRQEFERNGGRTNLDTPGTNSSDLPYGIMADFLIALYDQDARKILEVGRSSGWLCVLEPNRKGTIFVRTR